MIVEEKQKAPAKQVLPDRYKQVLRLIPTDKTITSSEIAKLTNLKTTDVRFIISQLITEYSVPIGTSNEQRGGGYQIITDDRQLEKTVNNLKGRAQKITKRYQALQAIDLDTWRNYIDDEV